jgi:2-polyprenyl-6-methoxyphenol hydroxylase-like FAD-dependent oxidoreductase
MKACVGRQAVVVGSGIAGLAAAGALANWFERVIVLERDVVPDGITHRSGVPQGLHTHGLLVGGLSALEELFPGIGADFVRAGGVPLRVTQDLREEPPDRDPMPQRDFGLVGCTMSRPLIEHVLRRRLLQRSNVSIRHDARVVDIVTRIGPRVAAIRYTTGDDDRHLETLPADLIVDASGRGQLTLDLLRSMGRPLPDETKIGIDLGYSTVMFDIPDDAPPAWKLVITHARPPHSNRRAIMLPVEGNRWCLSVVGRGEERPPGEWEALRGYIRNLATSTIYDAVRHLRPIGPVARFGFRESFWRHFERVERFPDGLIPIGDAICRFNPVYGQGMTVAAKEAIILHRLLATLAFNREPLAGLGDIFLSEASSPIETAWLMAAVPDLAFPETRGDRPADLGRSLQFARALSRLAARDAAVQRLVVEVWHMLKPRSAYQDRELLARVEAEIAAESASPAPTNAPPARTVSDVAEPSPAEIIA